jgi:hypothetical protein
MKKIYLLVVFVTFSLAHAQLTVQSTDPANNATNVPLTTSLSVTFSAPLDTTYVLERDHGLFWSIENVSAPRYSADHRTVTFDVVLSAGQPYVVGIYNARAVGGATLQAPYGLVFTTGPSWPPYTVSGNVLSGTTGVSPANALVLLSTTPMTQGNPNPISGTIADGAGAFTLPHVPDGTYYPLAAKDANGDGSIDPSRGDVIAAGDPVTVSGGNVTGVNLTFELLGRVSLGSALAIADSISATLPPDKSLRSVSGWDADSAGEAENWEFSYLMNSLRGGYRVRVGVMEHFSETLDSASAWWMVPFRPVTNPGSAATSQVFLGNVENAGGREFRTQTHGSNVSFHCQAMLGDLRMSGMGWLITDTTRNYWGADYSFGNDSSNYWVAVTWKQFLGDYTTGAILAVTDVKPNGSTVPATMTLSQNYPNPFNPSTQIRFSVTRNEWTTLKVYNLLGQEVGTLVHGFVTPGEYTIRFDGNNLSSGIYFYRLVAGSQVATQRMILMK